MDDGYEEDIDPDIVATVAALGSLEGNKYVKAPECSICIVDLIKFLRLEDEKICNVRRQIAKTKTVEKDLLPILVTYEDEINLLENLVRLLVNLTMPAILCFKEVPTKKDKDFSTLNLEVNIYLREYKVSFVKLNAMRVFSMHLGRLLQIGSNNRTDEDDLLLERILIITRNLLHIPSDSVEEYEFQGSLTTHDKLILSMVEYGVDDLLLFLCGSQEEQQHCLLALEILFLMLRDFDAKTLALHNSTSCGDEVDKELKELREKELAKKTKHDKYRNTRHSRFGGTFVVKGMKSITDNDVIYHKNLKKVEKFSFDDEKARVRHVGHKRVVGDEIPKRHSTPQMRHTLQNLCKKFLDVCYNPLMKKVKSLLCRKSGQDNDETFYLWACHFFMEFNRTPKFQIELVAETLSIDSFSYILQLIFRFNESIKSLSAKEQRQLLEMSKRLHNAVKAYREMLDNLHLMVLSKDLKITGIANVIQSNIFYQQEYRELPTMLLKEFNRRNQSRSYLRDLVECTHIYIRMLDAYSADKPLIIQETKKQNKKKSKKSKKKKNMLSEEEMLEMWEGDIEREVINVMSSGSINTTNVQPFDASKDYTMEQQRILCKHNIQDLLKSGAVAEAISVYKSAREVWPDSPSFGMSDMSIIDEVEVMKSIFLSRDEIPTFDNDDDDGGHTVNIEMSETTVIHSVKERTFQNNEYLMLYARPMIISAYCYLLKYFEENSAQTNHASLKMLYRQATKNGMASMLFQVSFFETLMRIMNAPKIEAYKDLQKFAAFLVRKFTSQLKESPMLSLDALFWKSPNDVLLIDNKYDEDKMPHKIHAVEWSPQEEVELRMLFEKYIDRASELDLCEMISEDLQSEDKDRMAVKSQIIALKLCDESNKWALKKPKQSRKQQWLPDEHEALRKLYEEYMYERDPVALIQEKLDTKSRKKIVAELGDLLGVRPKDLDVNRVIWTKDDDEELKILYDHLSEEKSGDALLEAISDKIPKNRLKTEIKDALIRLKLQRNENSKEHFWSKEERSVLNNHSNLSNKKEMMEKLIPLLPNVSRSDIIQELISLKLLSVEERTTLMLDYINSGGDSEEEESDDEEDEEEFDFFEIPKLLRSLQSTHKEELSWICGLLKNAIESRDGLDYDTVFIVPRSDIHSDALENTEFCHMLKCLGAIPPLSGHENYWKITSAISDNILRKGEAMLRGEIVYSEEEDFISSAPTKKIIESSSEEDGDIDDFFSKIRSNSPETAKKVTKGPGKSVGTTRERSQSKESTELSPTRCTLSPMKSTLSPNNSTLSQTKVNRSRQFSDSDDDDELPGVEIDEDESDKENTHSKRPRGSTFVDSDSDTNSNLRNSQKKSRPRLIMSDSE